ncbi:DNA-methyltransferase [Ruminococcus sp. LCP21S3_E8]|nr:MULTISPECIES: site-specific DNA-methyltransferase [Ruminococcus]MCI5616478.1 site-specific DNA-methyltransferase [Ruminococcus sp.]MDD6530849.1 site-specific DNA-methyltransferase [Ruminococcus sp.]MDY3661917.1 site-specific DNA-methyltransferase [Ruminococcus bovis]
MIDVNDIKDYLLINDDCFSVLKNIPDHSVDLILTDPPYNIAKYSTGNMKFNWRSEINNDLAEWDLSELNPKDLIGEFKRVLKPNGNIFIFCSYNIIGEYHKVFDPEFDTFQFMVWHKTNPVPNFRKSSFLNSCELIVSCWNKGHTWNFTNQRDMHNFIENSICMGSERVKNKDGKSLHPTQKPVAILEKIVKIASNENDLVLDCFNGVGSTGVASLKNNRRYLGIEIDKTYMDATEQRLKIYKKK